MKRALKIIERLMLASRLGSLERELDAARIWRHGAVSIAEFNAVAALAEPRVDSRQFIIYFSLLREIRPDGLPYGIDFSIALIEESLGVPLSFDSARAYAEFEDYERDRYPERFQMADAAHARPILGMAP